MRHLTDEGLALIKRFEGFSPEIYICPGGWPTIGYGHVVREDERERFADGIGEATAEELLRHDVKTAERAVLRLIRVPLEDGRFDALASFTFNLGAGALQRSTLRRRVSTERNTTPCRPSLGAGCSPAGASSRGWCCGGRRRRGSMPGRTSRNSWWRRATSARVTSATLSRPNAGTMKS